MVDGSHEGNEGAEERVDLSLDRRTAELLRAALYDLGEHQAAGAPIGLAAPEEAEKLGALLRDLDRHLGGSGRSA